MGLKRGPKPKFKTEEERKARRCAISNTSYYRNRESISHSRSMRYRELHPKPVDIVRRAQEEAASHEDAELSDPLYWVRRATGIPPQLVSIIGKQPMSYFANQAVILLKILEGNSSNNQALSSLKENHTHTLALSNLINLIHEKVLNLVGVGEALAEIGRIKDQVDKGRRCFAELVGYAEMEDGCALIKDKLDGKRLMFQSVWS
ncbi:hypothetical protein BKA70DRAFT_1419259 [Coprinopsis sp. MPI-PUGE-AT-0042]|nr:hypothetical protein BKA70DRAFT_1419259 [Coprinopsis sp. MPI-PUGE-AT-0042]